MKINLEVLNAVYLYGQESVENLNTKELVPKMMIRRRLTRASKLIIELFSKLDTSESRIVYGTSYGELLASSRILNSILNEDILSPTDFQNSVYNTAVSYASILNNNSSEILTVSSGNETSLKVLKVGAVKALDGDELILICSETLDIENIDEVNKCIEFLESAVILKIKITQKEANLKYDDKVKGFPDSMAHMINIAKSFNENKENIIEVNF
jgi:hypothetical protein